MNRTLFRVGVAHFVVVIVASTFGCSDSDDEQDESCESLPSLTVEECEAEGGTAHGDPGDGSSCRVGCPGSEKIIATLEFGIEGGICCK